MSVLHDCKEYCQRKGMFSCKAILVGVSGGADSMCLLDLLVTIRDGCDDTGLFPVISVAHVHHGLRESADADEKTVRDYCEQRGIPFYVCHADVAQEASKRKIGIEEAGRLVRYDFFHETASKMAVHEADVFIAVAHHMDDQAETVLLNLFRGAGTDGMCGIYPRKGNVIRPLLFATKRDIMRYVEEHNIPYVSDQTNFENDYARNRIRNQVLPVIAQAIRKDPVTFLSRTADLMKADRAFFAGIIDNRMQEKLSYTGDGSPVLSVLDFASEPDAIATRMIRSLFGHAFGDQKDITSVQVEAILSLARKHSSGGRISLPHRRFAGIEDGVLFFAEASDQEKSGFRYVRFPEQYLLCPENRVCDVALLDDHISKERSIRFSENDCNVSVLFVENTDQLVYNNLTWYCTMETLRGAHMRTRRQGDTFAQAGSSGHKLLRRFLTDRKIANCLRDRLLIVAKGSEVLWIPGLGHACGFVNEESAKRFFSEAMAEDSNAYFASGRMLLRVEWAHG